MKKIGINIVFCFSIFMVRAQNIKIEYLTTINDSKTPQLNKQIKHNLILVGFQSAYFNYKNDIEHQYKEFIDQKETINGVDFVYFEDGIRDVLSEDYFFKDYKNQRLYFKDYVVTKPISIKENLELFDWKIIPNKTKNYLNQKCRIATTKFRGRQYKAYFSDDIISHGGPWKFDGLPGLILKIFSEDGYFSIEATSIKSFVESNTLNNPFKDTKTISWEMFEKLHQDKMNDTYEYLRSISDDEDQITIKMANRIEKLNIQPIK